MQGNGQVLLFALKSRDGRYQSRAVSGQDGLNLCHNCSGGWLNMERRGHHPLQAGTLERDCHFTLNEQQSFGFVAISPLLSSEIDLIPRASVTSILCALPGPG